MSIHNALAALCVASLSVAAAADTINVPADFATIGEAVGAAQNGDTIVVKKGRYAESVTINGFNGLTVRAKGKVVVDPPDGAGLLVVDSEDVLIQGIGVEGGADGFVVDNCQNVELAKFSVKGVDRHGVFVFGSTNVDLTKGKVDDCGVDGVSYADSMPEAPVVGGTISGVKVSNCDEDGIDVLGSDIFVVKCTATDCDDDTFESDDEGPGPIRFEKCKASNSGDEGFEVACPGTILIKCTSKNSREDGFDIEGDDCELEKCTAKGADEAGFSVDDIDNAKLTKCKAIKCNDEGFDFLDATNAALEKCTAKKSGRTGFRLDSGTQNCVLTKCKGSKSGTFDLDDQSDGSNTFPGSKFKTVSPNDG